MSNKGATVDVAMAEIADRQHGVVATHQLMAIGIDRHGVIHRARTGRLHRVHRGVYSAGHSALSSEAQWMAAVLACGRPGGTGAVLIYWGAALSHRSAASLWGLLPRTEGPVDVSIAGDGGRKRRRGIRLHRSQTLVPAAVRLCSSIPITSPARTIADLRRSVSTPARRGLISPTELRRAIRQANVLGLPIGPESGRDRTRSELERDFLRLCRCRRLPAPEVNVRVGRHLVDFLWRDRQLIVETDGYIHHRGREAFEDDCTRDLELRAQGFEVIRLAEKQIEEDAERVAEVVSAALRVGAHAPGVA